MTKATMMVSTTEGLRETRTQSITSSDAKAVVEFLKGSLVTMGFSLTYAIDPTTKRVLSIFKKGRPIQRDLKPMIEAGFTEFHYSWAFSGKVFRFEDGTDVTAAQLDLTTAKDILPWARAFGAI
jgi:hypothetical protein